ncbi:hypothetical protein [Cohnella panacarvi]|uniref:hypothetical protein n=1 Tax=Cohnella panacarvi TaxID=400776 RepID=UPI00047A7F59|nr:hypothetical protein [Cohnella panacarvi]
METIQSSEVRKHWGKTFDEAFYKGPAVIEKNNRVNLLIAAPHVKSLLSREFPIQISIEKAEGVLMATMTGIPDIFGYGDTEKDALADLFSHLKVLIDEMLEDFGRFSSERPRDAFYLLQLVETESEKVEELVAVTVHG